jgi:putative membrane protein
MEMKSMDYAWHFDFSIVVIGLAIVYCYYLVSGFKLNKNGWCFWVAILLFFLIESAPLHYLGMGGDFSAHMISHVILLLLCGPLLVLGIPSKPALRTLQPLLKVSQFFSRHSWVAWFTGVGIMWLLHIPAVFNSAIGQNMLLHNGSLLLAGMIFSWPLFGPIKRDHIHPVYGIVYLFTACISCSLLGLIITFAPLNTYGHFSQQDQQAAGLIMWVPCCFVYLSGCLYLLMRWFAERTENVADNYSKLNHSLHTHEGR